MLSDALHSTKRKLPSQKQRFSTMPFQNPTLHGTSVSSTFQVREFTVLLLLITENLQVQGWGSLQWHNDHTKFRENRLTCSYV
jgi:hypothetical protein